MPQSLANVLVHLVFSTKYRRPFLHQAQHRDVIRSYLIGTLQNVRYASVITKGGMIVAGTGGRVTALQALGAVGWAP